MTVSDDVQRENADATLLEPGELRSAIEEISRRDGWEAATDLFQRHWDRYATRAPDALLEALKALPGEVFVVRPSMLVAADYLQQVASGQDPRRFHDGARDIYGGVREPRELIDALIALTGRAAGARTGGSLDKARRRAVDARRMLDRADEAARASARGALPHLMFQWGRCLEVTDADGAIAEYEQSHELGMLTGQEEIARRAAGSLAWLLAERGWIGDARYWLARARATDRESPRYDAVLHLTGALIAVDELDDEAAGRELAALDDESVGEYWAARLWVRAATARGPLAPLIVRHAMTGEVQRHAPGLFEGANRRYLVRAATALADELGEDVAPDLEPRGADEPLGPVELLCRVSGQYRAGAHLAARASARAVLAAAPAARDEAVAHLLVAASEHALGNTDAAASAFWRARAVIEHEGLLRCYVLLTRADLTALCAVSGVELSPRVAEVMRTAHDVREAAAPGLTSLTRRERELLALIGDGRSFAEIAEALFISPNTVKTLTRGLYRKLGVHSREEAASLAHRA